MASLPKGNDVGIAVTLVARLILIQASTNLMMVVFIKFGIVQLPLNHVLVKCINIICTTNVNAAYVQTNNNAQ
jgi:hypothetical protein